MFVAVWQSSNRFHGRRGGFCSEHGVGVCCSGSEANSGTVKHRDHLGVSSVGLSRVLLPHGVVQIINLQMVSSDKSITSMPRSHS